MKTKLVLVIIALLFSATVVKAQTDTLNKYEFMIIEFNPQLNKQIQISIEGKQYIEEKADFTNTRETTNNNTPLLKKVSEYQDKGWEVMNFQALLHPSLTYYHYCAFLRKKKIESK